MVDELLKLVREARDMVSATHRPEAADLLARIPVTTSSSKKSESSFSQQLASALEGSPAGREKESASRIISHAAARHDFAASQTNGAVTPRPASPTANSTASTNSTTTPAPTATSTSPASDIPTMLGMGPVAGTAPVQESSNPQSTTAAPEMTEADAYWSQQPAAVQALRNMPDGQAKDDLALKLANAGYSIDTQIMVWGWDPQMTMQVRENQGYSWVPSYGSANIPVGPGLSVPGESNTYNPANPPPGAIIVSTAFANGTIQNPLVQTDSSSST